LELCLHKVKDGGIIAGHDYCQGDINNAQPYGVVLELYTVKNAISSIARLLEFIDIKVDL